MRSNRNRVGRILATALAGIGLSGAAASAGVSNWSATPADGNWSNAANWDVAPVAGDTLGFDASTVTALNNDIVGGSYGGIGFGSSAPAYTITGNGITLTGNMATAASNLQTIDLDIVTTAVRTVTTVAGGDITLSGDISGTGGGITSNGAGVLTLSGANSYDGPTTMNHTSGTLVLAGSNSSGGATALTNGTLKLGGTSNGGLAGGTLTLTAGFLEAVEAPRTIANAVAYTSVTVQGSQDLTLTGTLTANGSSNRTLTNNIDAGRTLTLGNVVITGSGTTARTLTITGTGDTTIAGTISDGTKAGSKLTLSGTGTKILQSDMAYTGTTVVSGGTAIFNGKLNGISGTAGLVTVSGGGTLILNADNSAQANSITVGAASTLRVGAANNLPTGVLTLSDGTATLDLRNDTGTNYAKDLAATSGTINVDRAVGGIGVNQTHTLGNITGFGSAAAGGTLNVTGANGYGLTVGTITSTTVTAANKTWAINNDAPGLLTIAGFTGDTTVTNTILKLGGTGNGKITGAVAAGGAGAVTIRKTGLGTWTMGTGVSTGGPINVSAGVLDLNNLDVTATPATTTSAALMMIVNNSGLAPGNTATLNTGTGTLTLAGYVWSSDAGNSAGSFINGNLDLGTLNPAVCGTQTGRIFSTDRLDNHNYGITVNAVVSGPSTMPLIKTNIGNLYLANAANTYTGLTYLCEGVLAVNKLANGGSNSGIGASSSAAGNLIFGPDFGILRYLGSGDSTDRLFTIEDGDAAIEASGSGALKFTNSGAIVVPAGLAVALVLGGSNTGDNTFGPALVDGSGGTTYLTKHGAATWVMAGTNQYSGTTTIDVNGGILQFARRVSLYNATPASWTAGNIVVRSGGTASFNVGGAGEFTAADIDIIAPLGTDATGFMNGSRIGFDTTNAAGGTFTYSTAIGNPNAGANVLGLTKRGTGELVLAGANSYTGQTIVAGGKLTVKPAASTVIISGGGVDIQKGTLSFDYTGGSSPVATIQGLLTTSYNGGAWNAGQFKCTTQTSSAGLGWVDNGTTALRVMYTLYGDATLDGTVNFNDLLKLSQNYNLSGKTWAQGDSNYDGMVNFNDLLKLSQNYNQSIGSPGAGDMTAAAVPEPGAIGLLLAAAGLLGRRGGGRG